MASAKPLVLLCEPSTAFAGFTEHLVREAGFPVQRVTLEELSHEPSSPPDALSLTCGTLLGSPDSDPYYAVQWVADPRSVLLRVPKAFSTKQLREAVRELLRRRKESDGQTYPRVSCSDS